VVGSDGVSGTSRQPAALVRGGPDACNVYQFLHGVFDLIVRGKARHVPTSLVVKLAKLASVNDDEVLRFGIALATRMGTREASLLSAPVYRRDFIRQFEEIGRVARKLQHQLTALHDPKDHTSLWVGRALGHSVNIVLDRAGKSVKDDTLRRLKPLAPFLEPLSKLEQASGSAKRWADLFDVKAKGRPAGVKGCGVALTRFIVHLEFAARLAGGGWTLDKNDESGSLIDGLELLRSLLPDKLIPPRKKHPYSTYQNILTHARSEWKADSATTPLTRMIRGRLGGDGP
jgi:hypothetical protein